MKADTSICTPKSRFKDITGQRFGLLQAVRISGKTTQGHIWICNCSCGKKKEVEGYLLRLGKVRSCGCLKRGRTKNHGLSGSSTYSSWLNMRKRCSSSKVYNFHNYGGRGISVCERWEKFTNFLEDMGEKPSSIHSIDRIDVNGNYTPQNCRWATPKEQCVNRRKKYPS